MENSAVNICMITDDNYIMPTSVAIHSMITNKDEEQYNFYIITSNLSEESEKKFKDFEQNGVCINIIREDAEKRFNGLHNFRADSICVASLSALLKFIIPDLFPQLDRILYLDGDLFKVVIVFGEPEEPEHTEREAEQANDKAQTGGKKKEKKSGKGFRKPHLRIRFRKPVTVERDTDPVSEDDNGESLR